MSTNVLRTYKNSPEVRAAKTAKYRRWAERHPELARAANTRGTERRRASLPARMLKALDARLKKALDGLPQLGSIDELVGIPYDKFCAYILTLLPADLTPDGYGCIWSIDHIRPFGDMTREELSTQEGQRSIMHYTNCQPLRIERNREKETGEDWLATMRANVCTLERKRPNDPRLPAMRARIAAEDAQRAAA